MKILFLFFAFLQISLLFAANFEELSIKIRTQLEQGETEQAIKTLTELSNTFPNHERVGFEFRAAAYMFNWFQNFHTEADLLMEAGRIFASTQLHGPAIETYQLARTALQRLQNTTAEIAIVDAEIEIQRVLFEGDYAGYNPEIERLLSC